MESSDNELHPDFPGSLDSTPDPNNYSDGPFASSSRASPETDFDSDLSPSLDEGVDLSTPEPSNHSDEDQLSPPLSPDSLHDFSDPEIDYDVDLAYDLYDEDLNDIIINGFGGDRGLTPNFEPLRPVDLFGGYGLPNLFNPHDSPSIRSSSSSVSPPPEYFDEFDPVSLDSHGETDNPEDSDDPWEEEDSDDPSEEEDSDDPLDDEDNEESEEPDDSETSGSERVSELDAEDFGNSAALGYYFAAAHSNPSGNRWHRFVRIAHILDHTIRSRLAQYSASALEWRHSVPLPEDAGEQSIADLEARVQLFTGQETRLRSQLDLLEDLHDQAWEHAGELPAVDGARAGRLLTTQRAGHIHLLNNIGEALGSAVRERDSAVNRLQRLRSELPRRGGTWNAELERFNDGIVHDRARHRVQGFSSPHRRRSASPRRDVNENFHNLRAPRDELVGVEFGHGRDRENNRSNRDSPFGPSAAMDQPPRRAHQTVIDLTGDSDEDILLPDDPRFQQRPRSQDLQARQSQAEANNGEGSQNRNVRRQFSLNRRTPSLSRSDGAFLGGRGSENFIDLTDLDDSEDLVMSEAARNAAAARAAAPVAPGRLGRNDRRNHQSAGGRGARVAEVIDLLDDEEDGVVIQGASRPRAVPRRQPAVLPPPPRLPPPVVQPPNYGGFQGGFAYAFNRVAAPAFNYIAGVAGINRPGPEYDVEFVAAAPSRNPNHHHNRGPHAAAAAAAANPYMPLNPLGANLPNLNYGANGYNHPLHPAHKQHVPPPPAREGFTRDTGEEQVLCCPSCEEELAFDPEEDITPAKKAKNRKDREEHYFWAVKECGHVFCRACFENRTNKVKTAPRTAFRQEGKKSLCAVPDCNSDVTTKQNWVGLFLN